MDRESIGRPEPTAVVAVILGASEFPYADALPASPAFVGSASAFTEYLKSEHGLGLTDAQVLDLFDNDDNIIEQNDRLTEHLVRNENASDLIIYYVGHGGFLPDREYFLALRSTKRGAEGVTGLRIRALAHSLEEHFPGKRVFLILDCCFAGEAVAQFQSGELATIVENETFDALPAIGTSLLVAASKDEPAIAPTGAAFTMFSDCFLEVLRKGIADGREKLSLTEVGEVVQKLVRSKFGQRGVRPEVHSPRQGGGDVAKIPLFPNPAYSPPKPNALPPAIQDALRNPLADIRKGAIRPLAQFLVSGDRERARQARAELERLAARDDSRSVQRRAREALEKPKEEAESTTRPYTTETAPTPTRAKRAPPKQKAPSRRMLAIVASLAVLVLGAGVFWGIYDPGTGTDQVVNPTEVKVQQLLADAERHYQAGRLDSPKGENALEHYRAVLDLDPANQVARAGLDRVVTRYIALADSALAEQELDQAESFLAKVEGIAPANAEAAGVRTRLEEARRTTQERKEIRLLLAGAERDIQEGRLTGPQGKNAVEGYQAVLALDPDNQAARAGLDRVLNRYTALADGALDEQKLDEAGEYLAKAEGIAPASAEVAGIRDRIETARATTQDREKIRRLLADAENDLRQDRLTSPKGNNAVERYRAVLAFDSDNQAARAGLDRVVSRYIALADGAIAGQKLKQADDYLAKAEGIAPADAEVARARTRLENARATARARKKIELLLATAERDLRQGRLDSPKGNNAVEGYRAVLALDPDNRAARAGLGRVVGRYLELANRSLADQGLDQAADYLAKAEEIEPDNRELADVRTRLEEARKAPSRLAFAVFPFQSLAICHYSVRDEVTDAADSVIRNQPRANLEYSFYAEGADSKAIPDMYKLWSDNAARREPKLDIVRDAGRELGVNGVLMAWYKCSRSQYVSADTYEVEVYLIDVNRDQVFHAKEKFLDAGRATSKVFEQFFSAYGIGSG